MDWRKHSNLIFTDFKLAERTTYQTIKSLEELGQNIMDSTPSISEAHKTHLTILTVISETRGFD
jgi:phosphoribosyl 1,2-cyclic phosphodiesterase